MRGEEAGSSKLCVWSSESKCAVGSPLKIADFVNYFGYSDVFMAGSVKMELLKNVLVHKCSQNLH